MFFDLFDENMDQFFASILDCNVNNSFFNRVFGKNGFFKTNSGRGFYLYGDTGTGKTTKMIEFFDKIEKQTTFDGIVMHFHDYCIDISKLLMRYDIKNLAFAISKQIKILCFDEFFIESIADGRLLFDLFFELLRNGVFIFVTSNFLPEELYLGGFNREVLFPAFSDFLRQQFEIVEMKSDVDYREVMFDFDKSFLNGCGFCFDASDLFAKPTSQKDYIDILRLHHEVTIKNLPLLSNENEDIAIRFRNFVDLGYVRSINISFCKDDMIFFKQEMLENIKFKRTNSRLKEMSSFSYRNSKTKARKRFLADVARDFLSSL